MPYSAPSGTLFSVFDQSAETRISEAIGLKMIQLGKVWQETVLNNEGLESMTSGVASKNWLINKIYSVGQVGYGNMSATDTFLFGEQNKTFGHFGRRSAFSAVSLDPALTPKKRNILFSIPVRSQDWMLTRTIGEALYSTNPAMAGDIDADEELAFAESVARRQCLTWYTSQNASYSFCTVSSGGWKKRNGEATNVNTFQFQTSNSAIERFNEGDMIDFRDSSSPGTLRNTVSGNPVYGYVVSVDPSANAVEIQFLQSDGTLVVGSGSTPPFTISDGDLVVPFGDYDSGNSKFLGFAGINSYLKASGTLLGDDAVGSTGNGSIDVAELPQFRSVEAAINGSLTPEVLTRYVSLILRQSQRFGTGVDTLYTTPAVLRQAINEMKAYYMATGTGVGPEMPIQATGDGGYHFTIDGKTFRIIPDPWVEAGALYGTQMAGGNWRRVVPDDPVTGFTTAPVIPTQIPFRFIAQWYGMNGDSFPIYDTSGSTNRITEGLQRPGVIRYQVYPQNPVGLKLTGLTEDNVFQTAAA